MATLFFSYSHKDEALRDRLEVHLAVLKDEGLISTWHDRKILAGDEFDKAIGVQIETADVILLLLSPDFLASRYIKDVEIKKALQRHERGVARVIPVILKPCNWKRSPFARLLVAPKDGRPITRWPDRNEAFLDVTEHIRAAVVGLAAAEVRPQHAPNEAVENSPDTLKTTENRSEHGSFLQPFGQRNIFRFGCVILLGLLMIGAAGLFLKTTMTRVTTSPSIGTPPTPPPTPLAIYPTGFFSLESRATGLVMTISGQGPQRDLLVQSDYVGQENQIWTTIPAGETRYCYLLTKYSAKLHPEQCLEIVSGGAEPDHLGLGPRRSDGADDQLWSFSEVEPGYYMIVSKRTPPRQAIDIPWGEMTEGLLLILYRAHGGENQLWKAVDRK